MIERAWTDVVDRAGWASGPWDAEPQDKVQWLTEVGLAGLARRNPMGAWCGYVGLDESHPWHGKDCEEVPDVEVYGGLTYSAPCQEDHEAGICHIPEPSEPTELWWLGFDCAHGYDRIPAMVALGPKWVTYKDLSYVRAETEALAAQLAAVAP